jgi:hypothetical protein
MLIVAASCLFGAAGQVFANTSTTPPSDTGSASPAEAPAAPSTSNPASSTSPDSAAAPSAPASGASAAAAAFTVGEPVKDNTGATIGQISDLKNDASGQQTAVITMGSQSFQVAANRLGASNGAATINLTQAQISAMLNSASHSH